MELVFTDREGPEERWLAAGGDAEALVAAPVTPVTEELIARMPHLKLIHSDGVGYDRIDLAAARDHRQETEKRSAALWLSSAALLVILLI